MTQEGQVLGTPAYMSPEQARGRVAPGRCPQRRLQPRRRPLRAADRRAALPRQPADADPAGPRGRAAAAAPAQRQDPARPGDDLPEGDGQVAGPPLCHGRRAGRRPAPLPRGRADPRAAGRADRAALALVPAQSRCGRACCWRCRSVRRSALWHLSRLSEQLVGRRALESAAQQSEMLDVVNTFYSSQVVERVQVKGSWSRTTTRAEGRDPAAGDVHHRVWAARSANGARRACCSGSTAITPSARAKTAGPTTTSRRRPWRVAASTRQPFYRFEVFQGRPRCGMRPRSGWRPIASVPQQPHDSTKRDWKEGEVGGVLEIIRPLDRDIARTRRGPAGTFMLMAAVSGSLLGSPGWCHPGGPAPRDRVTPPR